MKYLFLQPKKMPRNNHPIIISRHEAAEFVHGWEVSKGREIHIDLETTGLDWHFKDNGQQIVSIAIVSNTSQFYVDTRSLSQLEWKIFIEKLSTCSLFAFNTVFDGGWLYRQALACGADGNALLEALSGCTLTLFRALANEGQFGQTHSLETAMETVLLWDNINKHWLKEALARHELHKGQMYKLQDLEPEAFAEYNVLDAEASLRLNELFISNLSTRGLLHRYEFHLNEEMVQIRELIEQQWHGILVHQERLDAYIEQLNKELVEAEHAFRNHTLTKKHIDAWEADAAEEYYAPHVAIKRVFAKRADAPWEHPEEWLIHPIAEGEGSKRAKWEQDLGCRFFKEVEVKRPRNEGKPAPKFNMQSNAHMQWLLYGKLYKWEKKDRMVVIHLGNRSVELFLTKEGGLPVGKEMYQVLPELGDIIGKHSAIEKKIGYAMSLKQKSSYDGRLHPQFKPHGTMNGRLSATGSFNCQQLVKDKGFLDCFIPDPGHVFIDNDFNSLEPVVQTEFSKDDTLRDLYLSGKPHDIYLFWARLIHPDANIRKQLMVEYEKALSTNTMDIMKKERKAVRTFIKPGVLGFSYGLAAKKLYASWKRQGYNVTFQDCVDTYEAYWNKLSTYREWAGMLKEEVMRRGGWMLNGFGFPLAIPEERMKDVANAFAQSTGHGVLMVYNKHIRRLLKKYNVSTHIPIIQDFHDERISQVAIEDKDRFVQILNEAMDATNEELKPSIKFKGAPCISDSFWEFKKS